MKELIYHRLFLPAAETFGPRPAVHDGSYGASFASHAARVLRLADAMRRELGLAGDDRFAVLSANSHEYIELYHAAFLGAAVINPVNVRLADPELGHVIAHSGARVLFADATFATRAAAIIERLGADSPVERVVLIGDARDVAGAVRYDELVAAGEERVPAEPDEDDVPMLMYTGGTTGLPKGVVLSQRASMLNLYHLAMVSGLAFSDDAVYLHHTPLFHVTGTNSALSAAAYGTEGVVLPGFDPELLMQACERHGVTETVLVPTMMAMILNSPGFRPERLRSLRRIGYGGAPMPSALLDRMRAISPGVEFLQGYGMTEAAAALTFLTARDHERDEQTLRSVGRALPGVQLRICDGDGTEVPRGHVGEVCVRAGNLMSGYWRDPEATARVFRHGWYRTGDLGRLDEGGYLHLVDRADDMIITGGENVYSLEVENALATHPAVAQVAVIGVPHDTWGQQVHAIVVLRPGHTATPHELAEHARTSVARYKVPKSFEIRTEPLPVSAAMKPLKRALRRESAPLAGAH